MPSFKYFRVEEFIDEIYKAKAYAKDSLSGCAWFAAKSLAYVSRTAENNSVELFIDEKDGLAIEKGQAITVGDTTATISWQENDFLAGDHIVVIRSKHFNKLNALYLITLLRKETYRYCYGRAFVIEKIKHTELFLPCKKVNKEIIPDWDYMENYIRSLNIVLPETKNNQTYFAALNKENWEMFCVKDIFIIQNGRGITNEEIEENKGNFPAVQSGAENNGIIGHIDLNYCKNQNYCYEVEPCLTVARTGSSGFISLQPNGCVVGDSAKILKLKERGYNSIYVLIFLRTILLKLMYKYAYGRKVTEEKYYEEMILLPSKSDKSPDWEYMENYIKSLPYGDCV